MIFSNTKESLFNGHREDLQSASSGELRSAKTLNGPVLAALIASRRIDEIAGLFGISPEDLSYCRERFEI